MPNSTHQPLPQRRILFVHSPLGLSRLPSAAADLILLGDLTGRYANGSYSRLASDGRTVSLRADHQRAAEHGHRITAAIACHVARADGTLDQMTQFLLHPEHEGGRHARQIALRSGQSRALDYICRVWPVPRTRSAAPGRWAPATTPTRFSPRCATASRPRPGAGSGDGPRYGSCERT
ncbi:hypothetical protein [Streptomyces sp. NPDC002685]|uniref:hypothetical protein n=1 Tax=Streptomyces sp. NPDC002685 TaxID=3154540 RepID=UPI00331F828B